MSTPRHTEPRATAAQAPAATSVNVDYLDFVGGDDPDFALDAFDRQGMPLVCAIPGLRSVLSQCR